MSDLLDAIADLQIIENLYSNKIGHIRRKKGELKQQQLRDNPGQRLVSDHALIRYLERHKDIDIENYRNELRSLASEATAAKDGEHHWHPSGVIMVLGVEGQVITVLSPEQADKWTGRKLANGERIEPAHPIQEQET